MLTADGFRSAGNEQDESDNEADVEGETAVQQAWTELADIEREQERWSQLRTHIEEKLEICRQRGVTLEDVSSPSNEPINNILRKHIPIVIYC